jgi:hypothetical protein
MGPEPAELDLTREIKELGELLEEEPGSKCETCFLYSCFHSYSVSGCLQTLLHYILLQSKHLDDPSADDLRCRELLDTLEKIDPLRRGRYKDLGRKV